MSKKNVLIIILTALVFLSTATLGVATTYRVDDVCVVPVTVSAEAEEEAKTLQTRLKEAYEKQSSFFVNEEKAKEVLKDFPYFRLTSFSKEYPNLLVVKVTEDAEVYAVSAGESSSQYRILNADGIALGTRGDYVNRAEEETGALNILLSGTKMGAALSAEECVARFFPFCSVFSDLLEGEIRRNVVSVESIEPTSSAEDGYFRLTMREGVKIYIFDPLTDMLEKAESAVEKYLSLSVIEKMEGRIAVAKKTNAINADYAKEDNFDK